MKTIIASLIFLAILGGCQEENIQEVKVGDTAHLILGQSLVLDLGTDQWQITFKSIEENSICPPYAVCIWQGRFVVALQIEDDLKSLGLGDLTNSEFSSELIMENIKIALTDVSNAESERVTTIELTFDQIN